MLECHICGLPVSPQRWNLGIHLCLECGELEAQKEKALKRQRTGVLYNKGPLMLFTRGVDLTKLNKN